MENKDNIFYVFKWRNDGRNKVILRNLEVELKLTNNKQGVFVNFNDLLKFLDSLITPFITNFVLIKIYGIVEGSVIDNSVNIKEARIIGILC